MTIDKPFLVTICVDEKIYDKTRTRQIRRRFENEADAIKFAEKSKNYCISENRLYLITVTGSKR